MNKIGYQGVAFGIMDGIITILGVLVGIGITGNRPFTIIGILAVGLADSFANSMGIHVSEETENIHSRKEIWQITGLCFLATFFTMIFLILPLLIFDFSIAFHMSYILGFILLIALGMFVSKQRGTKSGKLILEYLSVGIAVVIISYFIGGTLSGI